MARSIIKYEPPVLAPVSVQFGSFRFGLVHSRFVLLLPWQWCIYCIWFWCKDQLSYRRRTPKLEKTNNKWPGNFMWNDTHSTGDLSPICAFFFSIFLRAIAFEWLLIVPTFICFITVTVIRTVKLSTVHWDGDYFSFKFQILLRLFFSPCSVSTPTCSRIDASHLMHVT